MATEREERVIVVNKIIADIASRGRKFFHHDSRIAEIVDKGKIYYRAEWGSKEYICLSVPEYRKPRGWFHGGTLFSLVKEFRDFIKDGKPLYYSQLNSPHWGYPEEDMICIRKKALDLGFLTTESPDDKNKQ